MKKLTYSKHSHVHMHAHLLVGEFQIHICVLSFCSYAVCDINLSGLLSRTPYKLCAFMLTCMEIAMGQPLFNLCAPF